MQVADGITPGNVAISQGTLKGDEIGFGQMRTGNCGDSPPGIQGAGKLKTQLSFAHPGRDREVRQSQSHERKITRLGGEAKC